MEFKKKSKNFNILFFGHGSYLNRGCEAIITTTGSDIKKQNQENKIFVATFDYDNDLNQHNDIVDKYIKHNIKNELNISEKKIEKDLILNKKNQIEFENLYEKKVISEIDNTDICFSIGGDNYSEKAKPWLQAINNNVKSKNKKLILWSASAKEEIDDIETINDLRKFNIILTRESLTYKALSKFIYKDRLILLPDCAFGLKAKKTKLPEEFNQSKIVGINISPAVANYNKEQLDKLIINICKLIDHILINYSFSIALIPHVYIDNNNDLDVLRMIKNQYKNESRVFLVGENKLNCNELKYIISKCKFLIASRTHASIAGYSSNVPTLVLGYSVKSKGIALDIFGKYQDYVLPNEEINELNLIKSFEFLVKNENEIKKTLEIKMPIYKKQSLNLFETVLSKINDLDKLITPPEKCTGCGACFSSCPQKAITMKENNEGFIFPYINMNLCTGCNICKKNCPNNQNYQKNNHKITAFACKNKDLNQRLTSSSGGIFHLLASEIIKQKGCVFGAKFFDYGVNHTKIENEKDLNLIKGSKYVQSGIGNCYIEAKNELDKGRKVLFSGTPCQIEGLKKYLNKTYENLFCVSVVCHGVPSKKVLEEHLKELEEENKEKIVNIDFRNKENGWKNWNIIYVFKNINKKINLRKDNYMSGFLKNYYLRESCYNCDFKFGNKNFSDIILGDFWGIENEIKNFDDDIGVSAIIINSNKGQQLMNCIKDYMDFEEVDINQIINNNFCLKNSVLLNNHRFIFFNLLKKMGFNLAVTFLLNKDKIIELNNNLEENDKKIEKFKILYKKNKKFKNKKILIKKKISEKENEYFKLKKSMFFILWRIFLKFKKLI